ncbi:cytochrome c [Massilia sp. S19_KUP03_FR1]|uniref:cytochrome c n=1 Tax=Massilia sp. S19_KUP03_FR1 TaxID=3025503 RepID=UPI002FCDDA54
MKRWLLLLAILLGALLAWAWPRDQFIASNSRADWAFSTANVARGAYLARAGDCMGCHTVRGGSPYAGGRALATPFGTLYGPNLTPDLATGLGAWSADDFWGALHNGRSRGGRYLYPAFPFPHYTRTTRADSDALYAYLRSVAPVRQPNLAHTMDFPFNTQLALAGWRLFFFRPGVFVPAPEQGASWNRGAYLVEGLGHCSACHSSRNAFGASAAGLAGGMIPVLNWYAPSLHVDASWPQAELVQLLHTSTTPRATVFGPMAEVVANSLQYLTVQDVHAMALYLKALPASTTAALPVAAPDDAVMAAGLRLYDKHCMACHGSDGKGLAPAYPPLAGAQALTMAPSVNAVRIVLHGGFAPGTAANPRPYGMPPFAHVLEDEEVAQVVTYARASWGNKAGAVTAAQVNRYRSVPLE